MPPPKTPQPLALSAAIPRLAMLTLAEELAATPHLKMSHRTAYPVAAAVLAYVGLEPRPPGAPSTEESLTLVMPLAEFLAREPSARLGASRAITVANAIRNRYQLRHRRVLASGEDGPAPAPAATPDPDADDLAA